MKTVLCSTRMARPRSVLWSHWFGQTTLITRLVEKLKDRAGLAVFNGDATTSNDADQIARYGILVRTDRHDQWLSLNNLVGKACRKIDLGQGQAYFRREYRQFDLP